MVIFKYKRFILLALICEILTFGCKKEEEIIVPPKTVTPPVVVAKVKSYYVDIVNGSTANSGLTPTLAKKNIQEASDLTIPGDTVFIMNGTYTKTTYGSVLEFKNNGSTAGYITFKPMLGHKPKISAYGGSWNAMVITGSYVIFEGLDFEGNNANLNLIDAMKAFDDAADKIVGPQAAYNTNCISIGIAHHVIIRNCKVHDFPGGGIGVGAADYVTIENNTVYNNSWYGMYATSGISILGPKPIDDVTTYKMIIRGNTVYNNKTQVPWYTGKGRPYKLSDGNGIIIDVNNGTQSTPVYTGRTLVENNVSYNNGGGGIHAYQAVRVDIINNTAYHNGIIMDYPDIDGQSSKDINILNNIMYARNGGKCNGNDADAKYDYNIYFNGITYRKGTNDLVVEPNFVSLSINPVNANFTLQAGSPAVNSGTTQLFSKIDILGVARPKGSGIDRGAYESF